MQAKKDFEIQTIIHYEVLTTETIQSRKLFKDGNYSRKYGNQINLNAKSKKDHIQK